MMLAEIIRKAKLDKYIVTYKKGQILFLEGDDSQDLYVLVSGDLDVIKGDTKIARISESGALFGEMSFLLGARRTATVKAGTDVKTIRIPKEKITHFLNEFPEVASEISKILAQRLDESTHILYGLKDFCNQLPDAVILTDKDGKILTWNEAAERIYGRTWDQVRDKSLEEIFEEPQDYKSFPDEVKGRYSVREKIFKIKHPEKGIRYISTSTSVLYDGHQNFQGLLSIGRDVTPVKRMEHRYRMARFWLIPSSIIFALMIVAILYGYPYFSKGCQIMDVRKENLRSQMAKDYLLLKSLLADPFESGNRSKTNHILQDFFAIQEMDTIPYTGFILLDKEKRVFDAYSIESGGDSQKMLDSSYAGIDFQGNDRSLHRVLVLYRADENHPMGRKGIEVAFEMKNEGLSLGWGIFQMNMDILKAYEMDEEGLKKFHFKEP